MAGIDLERTFVPLKIAVLTISDTRVLEDDRSGSTLAERLTGAGIIWPIGRSSPMTWTRSALWCRPGSPIQTSMWC